MKRISEHELMDDVSQAKAYAEADFSEAHNAFVEYFKVRFPDFSSGEALAAYNVEEIRQQLNAAGLDYLTTEIVSDRHVLIWGRME